MTTAADIQNLLGTVPANPASGKNSLWFDASGVPHLLDSSGNDVYLPGNVGTAIVIGSVGATLTPPVLSDYVQVSFTTPATHTVIAIAATYIGKTITLEFTTAGTIVNGSNLVLPNGANIIVCAGMVLQFRQETSTLWRCVGRVNAAPAFRAYLSAGQNIAQASWVKCQHNTESYDTNANYDNATNYRFTPTVAGYYLAINHVSLELTTDQIDIYAVIYKNGASNSLTRVFSSAANTTFAEVVDIIYCNGSTDYLEAYCRHESAAAKTLTNSATNCYFTASLLMGV